MRFSKWDSYGFVINGCNYYLMEVISWMAELLRIDKKFDNIDWSYFYNLIIF